ncbi:MAG: cupin domain-containing protein [Thiobacillus sp.]
MNIRTGLRQWLARAAWSALLVAGPFAAAFAQDVPLARTAGDAALKWGACPDFMPKGCEIAVLHGDPARNNADVFFKVPANAAIPRHWHTSAERMVLVAGELHVTYDGHATTVLKPGTYAYGPPKLPHRAECKSAVPCVLFIAFESPVDAVAGGPPAK